MMPTPAIKTINVAILSLLAACSPKDDLEIESGDKLSYMISLQGTQRPHDEYPGVVQSVLSLAVAHDADSNISDWFIYAVFSGYSQSPGYSTELITPTGFELTSSNLSIGGRVGDYSHLTIAAGLTQEFTDTAPQPEPGQRWKASWRVIFRNRTTKRDIVMSTEPVLIY